MNNARSHSERKLIHEHGCCPECGRLTGFLDIGTAHFAICLHHRITWFAWVDLRPKGDEPERWSRNARLLVHFKTIDDRQAKFAIHCFEQAERIDDQERIDEIAAELLGWLDMGETE